MQSAASRFLRKAGLRLLACYFIVFFGVYHEVFHTHPNGTLLWFYAALPTLPLIGMVVLVGRYLRDESDGYKRDLAIRCLLWGLSGVISLQIFEGFLSIFGWPGHFPAFSALYAFGALMLAAKLSYRVANRVPADA